MAASVLALGMFISSLTESTVLAAIMTFALILLLWLVDAVAQGLPGVLGQANRPPVPSEALYRLHRGHF
jgi:ABC-2 type transport system permease protein